MRLVHGAQAFQRRDHGAAPGERRPARVGAELAPPAEGHHHHGGRDAEQQLADQTRDPERGPGALALLPAGQRAIDRVTDDARQRDHEGVHHALDQRQRHHVAVGDVTHLVPQHGFRLLARHAAQQAGADRDQGVVAAHAGGERVHVRRVVNGHFRHADAGQLGLPAHGVDEPGFQLAARLLDDLRADHALGGPLRHGERDERAAHAEHRREHQQRRHAALFRANAQQRHDDVERHTQHQQHGQVGQHEQQDTLHMEVPRQAPIKARYAPR